MSVTCRFDGRLGNILFSMATVIAHCKRHNLDWYFPTYAWACIDQRVPIQVPNTFPIPPINPTIYNEPHDTEGHPFYQEIPYMDNVEFRGYYQAWPHFESYRDEILKVINLPWYLNSGIVGLHIRRGDVVSQPDAFPMAPMEYYQVAIQYMRDRGMDVFRIFSDDIPWCKDHFTPGAFPGCTFVFTEGGTDVSDFTALSSCEHLITAASTFSLMAGWFNRNPDKIICVPSITRQKYWTFQNRDLLNTNFVTQLTW